MIDWKFPLPGRWVHAAERFLAALVVMNMTLLQPIDAQEAKAVSGSFIPQKELEGKLIPITGDHGYVDLDILFGFGTATLTDSAKRQLDALAGALSSPDLNDAKITVNGHTDAVGRADKNKVLSEKRAASVVRYLEKVHGLEASRLTAQGFGEEQLLPHLAPESKHQRRVQIVTTLVKKPADSGGSGTIVIN